MMQLLYPGAGTLEQDDSLELKPPVMETNCPGKNHGAACFR